MPRRARMYVTGLPYHIIQRGNNRQACFIEPENYQCYLELVMSDFDNRSNSNTASSSGICNADGYGQTRVS